MTNREYYKEQILDIVCKGNQFGFNKRTNKPCECNSLCSSGECLFLNRRGSCNDYLEEWCNAEYVEPCPFEDGELVEVSNDGIDWNLRYFSHFVANNETYKYAAFPSGLKDFKSTITWKYCRKYGTLGGLVEERI